MADRTTSAAPLADAPTRLLWFLAAVLAAAAVQRLGDGFAHLLLGAAPPIDLHYRWTEVQRWFAGEPVYHEGFAVYPPASYPLLWPLLGWLDFEAARWLWAITAGAGLAWLARTAARESGPHGRAALLVAALVPLAAYASRGVIVNGQIALHLLPLALGGLLLLHRRPPSLARDLAGAALLVAAVAKPTLTAPFVWIALTVERPVRPAAMIGLGYLALTAFAAAFQPGGAVEIAGRFARGAVSDVLRAAPDAHGNVHTWLAALGLPWAVAPVSLAILAALGLFVHLSRRADLWVRVGAAALVARMWAFHYRYDDVLVAVALVPLARMVAAGRRPAPADRPALTLLILAGASILMPASLLSPPAPWRAIEAAQAGIWLATLGFLVRRAFRPRPRPSAVAVQ